MMKSETSKIFVRIVVPILMFLQWVYLYIYINMQKVMKIEIKPALCLCDHSLSCVQERTIITEIIEDEIQN